MSDVGDEMAKFQLERRQIEAKEGLMLKSWLEGDDPNLLVKAQLHLEDVERRQKSGLKTLIFDPESRNQGDGYLRKARPLTFGTLRRMSRTPIISAIIKTRVEQISEFTTPQADKFQPGFVIRKKKTSYFTEVKKEVVDRGLQKRIDEMVNFIMNCGDNSNKWHGDTFDSLTRKVIPDSLSMDQASFEVVRDRRGLPKEVIAVDAATMRIADSYEDDEYQENKRQMINGYFPSYVQVIDGTVRNEYFPWELCFGIRNPNTNIYNNGYGASELEELMNVITWMLNADTHNGKYFSQGSNPKGIIKISGNVSSARLNEFRQTWQATTASVTNAHKIPVIESDNFEFIDFSKNNKDMEFSQWQEYLIKVSCAIYKIDPREVFDLQHTNSGSFGGSDKEESVRYSRDKGLRPLLKAYQSWLNKYIVNPKDSELELVFVGLDMDSEERELDLDIKRAGSFMTLKEVRAKHDLGEIDANDSVMSSEYIQWKQGQMAGGEDSNAAVDQFDDGNFDPEVEKAEEVNPFMVELNKYVERNLMN